MPEATRPMIPEGQVQVTPHGDGWWLIEIGRARYTKRFNLSAAEAQQLVQALDEYWVGR